MKYDSFTPGREWLDTEGKRIEAHGGTMLQEDGVSPMTAHTTNLVPFILCGAGTELRPGRLADIAPTILDVLGLALPPEMDGKTLIVK